MKQSIGFNTLNLVLVWTLVWMQMSSTSLALDLPSGHSQPPPLAQLQKLAGFGDSIGLSPFLSFKTIETPNFRITFPEELTLSAQRVANLYEEAHSLLSPVLKWQPSHRTQVVLLDSADLANGMTSPVARFGMVLYLTPPDVFFSTNNYDDWLRLLVLHEYTHFLNMDITQGFWEYTRIAFGDSFLPNSLWTTWMLEGLAVYMESRFTRTGRGNSTYYEMILREAFAAGVLDTPAFMTLDRLGGRDPWHPGGESPYFFGFELMNQIAKHHSNSSPAASHDGLYDALGEMSYQSGYRVPFFINGNLENITGKTWSNIWDDAMTEAKGRAQDALNKIRSAPVTEIIAITTGDRTTLGPAISPDGKWLAYTQASVDRKMGLQLQELASGKTERIQNKIFGAKMSFTPDSSFLIFSAVERVAQYHLWSDLFAYNLKSKKTTSLTKGLRARDPNISPDGRLLTFTLSEAETTGLGMAKLTLSEKGKLELSEVQKLFWPKRYDRISTPVFSRDGKEIAFSFKENGSVGEKIAVFRLDQPGQLRWISSSEANHRTPAYDFDNQLYYISDKSGVDNLYRAGSGTRSSSEGPVTNVISGISFPEFLPKTNSPDQTVFAAAYTWQGWNLAKFSIGSITQSPKINSPPPILPAEPISNRDGSIVPEISYPVEDYSLWPSLLPRQWYPLLTWSESSVYLGGQVLGWDAVDRHRYSLGVAYDTSIKKPDYFIEYTNRTLGAALTGGFREYTDSSSHAGSRLRSYDRTKTFGLTASFPILWTESSLTPLLGINGEQTEYFYPYLSEQALFRTRYVPSVDAVLSFRNLESSSLAIAPERGRSTLLGVRNYLETGDHTAKVALQDIENISLWDHHVLIPSLRVTWSQETSSTYEKKRVISRGRRPRILSPFEDSLFESIPLRGYPGTKFISKSLVNGSLQYHYPLMRIFRGLGTNPLFFEELSGYSFFDVAVFPGTSSLSVGPNARNSLMSAGSAVELNLNALLYIPLSLKVEYDYGFQKLQGGSSDFFFELGLSGLNF